MKRFPATRRQIRRPTLDDGGRPVPDLLGPGRTLAVAVGLVLLATGPALLSTRPALAECGLATGSAPAIMAGLAPRIARDAAGTVRIEPPFGPPQGVLNPKVQSFLQGSTDFAFLTRELAEADLATFRAHHAGREPSVLPIAAGNWNRFGYVDGVVMIVHRTNPVGSLSRAQIDAIFSTTRLRGHGPVATWADLGVADRPGAEPVRIVGGGGWQREESARALTIRRHVLSVGGRIGLWQEAPNSGSKAEVVAHVGRDPAAIGFTGMGHLSEHVRAVPVDGIALNAQTARDGSYPLLRTVDLLADVPGDRIDPRIRRLARSLLNRAGQRVIAAQGDFAPLPRRDLLKVRRRLAALGTRPACPDGGD